MKKFIAQVIIFSSLVVFAVGGLFVVTKKIIDKKTNYKLAEHIDKLIIGHSHPECAFNDTLIPSLKNFSHSAESYFYSYYKLVPLLNANKNVRTIFIELSNNQIDIERNQWIWGDNYLPFKYEVYGSFLDANALNLLLRKNPSGFIGAQTNLLKHNLKVIATRHYEFSLNRGGYERLSKQSVAADFTKLKVNKYNPGDHPELVNYNLIYLDKLIALCKSKNLAVYLMRSPMTKRYWELFDEPAFQNILLKKYGSLEFLDFVHCPLPDTAYADFEHLNYDGAKTFSLWFNKLLEDGLLKEKNKQAFIDNAIKNATWK